MSVCIMYSNTLLKNILSVMNRLSSVKNYTTFFFKQCHDGRARECDVKLFNCNMLCNWTQLDKNNRLGLEVTISARSPLREAILAETRPHSLETFMSFKIWCSILSCHLSSICFKLMNPTEFSGSHQVCSNVKKVGGCT